MGQYTGDSVYGRITYILRDTEFPQGIKPGYCIFSLESVYEGDTSVSLDDLVTGELKTVNPFFQEVKAGNKTFECRDYSDRDFKVGQIWILKEYEL